MKIKNIFQIIFLIIYFSLPLIGLFLFIQDGDIRNHESSLLGIFFGIASFTWLSLEFVLSARYRLLNKIYSFEKLYMFHGIMAVVSIYLAQLHHESVDDAEGPEEEFRFFFFKFETGEEGIGETVYDIFFALILLTLAFFTILAIMNYYKQTVDKFAERKEIAIIRDNIITYQFFKITHNIMAIGIIAMMIHVLLVNFSTMGSSSVMIYYIIIWLVGFTSWLYPKIIKPILRLRKPYIVKDIIQENKDIMTINLTPKNKGKVFDYKSGQYLHIGFLRKGVLFEMHPFTISSSPLSSNEISITVKDLGDYTRKLKSLKVGSRAYLEAPFGDFSYQNLKNKEEPLIFLAGGIGITPMMSMLRNIYLSGSQRKIHLIWANKSSQDILPSYKEEFDRILKEKSNIKIDYILSRDPDFDGYKGRLDDEKLKRILSPELFHNGQFFICGSNAFTNALKKSLSRLQVRSNRIHFERFSFLALFERILFPILNMLEKSIKKFRKK